MKKILPIVITVVALIIYGWWQVQSNELLTVTFFDIGQGDAALIKTPAQQIILIDGGPDRTILDKLGQHLPWTERSIDLIILSHPHADHVAGLNHVLQRYQVKHVLLTGALHSTPEYLKFLSLLKEKNISTTIAAAGKTFNLDGGVSIKILWPLTSLNQSRPDDLNDSSIVNRVDFGEVSLLFTGDTPVANEKELIDGNYELNADILKVAHQGSKTSSSEEFIKAVSPQIAIISVGKNSYGHPHEEIMMRLKSLVQEVWRTDQEGDITYLSDGKSIWRE